LAGSRRSLGTRASVTTTPTGTAEGSTSRGRTSPASSDRSGRHRRSRGQCPLQRDRVDRLPAARRTSRLRCALHRYRHPPLPDVSSLFLSRRTRRAPARPALTPTARLGDTAATLKPPEQTGAVESPGSATRHSGCRPRLMSVTSAIRTSRVGHDPGQRARRCAGRPRQTEFGAVGRAAGVGGAATDECRGPSAGPAAVFPGTRRRPRSRS
jgi:hypothetical protein